MPGVDENPEDDTTDGAASEPRAMVTSGTGAVLPFDGLEAPAPLPTEPPTAARWVAFGLILIAGLLGGLIGYGTTEVMGGGSVVAALGGILGSLICAVGVGIVAGLTLRAMNEWHAVQHPEAPAGGSSTRMRRAKGRPDR